MSATRRIALTILYSALAMSLAACGAPTATTPAPAATPVTAITRERAIELATQMCRVPHMVLLGEPRNIRAQLVGPVWQVQMDGQLVLVGGPAPQPDMTAAPPTPFEGTCTARIDAATGEWIGNTDVPLATP